MHDGLGDWIGWWLSLDVNKQGKVTCAELTCGVPIEAPCAQWQLQQVAQLSVWSDKHISSPQHMHNLMTWADAPTWLKKELDKVLTLQADVNVIKSALNSIQLLQRSKPLMLPSLLSQHLNAHTAAYWRMLRVYSHGQPKSTCVGDLIVALEKIPQKVWNCRNEPFQCKRRDWHELITQKK